MAQKRAQDEQSTASIPKAARRNRWDTPSPAEAAVAPTNGAASLPGLSNSVQAAKELAKEALAKAQKAASMQKAISTQMSNMVGLPAGIDISLKPKPAPQTVRLDAQGRLLDEQGKIVQTKQHSSIMANQNNVKNALLEVLEAPPDISSNKYYDPRMNLPGELRERRKTRAFNFVAEGSWSRKGDDLRAKVAVEQMLADAKQKSKAPKFPTLGGSKDEHAALSAMPLWGGQAGASGAASSSTAVQAATAVLGATLMQKIAEVPAVEWWDLPLLRGNSYTATPGNSLDANMMLEVVTHYVEHPVPVEPPAEPAAPPPQPLPLTKRERKKLRTQRRLAAEKERQDQIRCGLMPPPPPKVKISNLMQAMKDEAVADPTAMEAKVRAEMAQRIKNHDMRNQARKLTPEQRKEKKRRKMLNDASGGGVPVTLYRIEEIPSKQKLYKIDINAQQNHLTGCALLVDDLCVVIVEGGPKAQKRYRKLLMQRIDWGDAAEDEDDEDEDREERRRTAAERCKLLWEGQVIKANFKAFRVEPARVADVARKLLKERGCEHYWDMAVRYGEEEEDVDMSMFVPQTQRAGDEDEDEDEECEEGGADDGAEEEEAEEMED